MKKIAIAMLTTAMIGTPAFAASNYGTSNNNQQQQPQGAQMLQQPQNNDQAQQNKQNQQNQQKAQNQQNQNQQTSENNQPMQPHDLSRGEIRQVQKTLDKDGFKAGTADGRWGPHTQGAVKQFQQSKQIQANGQLNEQTVADLGLDLSQQQQK